MTGVNGVKITLLTSVITLTMIHIILRIIKVPPAERTTPRLPPLTEGEGVLLVFARYSITAHVEGLPEGEGAFAVGAFYDLIHYRA